MAADVEQVIAALMHPRINDSKTENGLGATGSRSIGHEDAGFLRFKEKFEELVQFELLQRPHMLDVGREKAPAEEGGGESIHDRKDGVWHHVLERANKTVLTLYGGAPVPRQLFSSLPLASAGPELTDEALDGHSMGGQEEVGSPATRGCTAKWYLYHEDHSHPRDWHRSQGESSNTRGSVRFDPSLSHPPKYPKHPATRSQASWYNPARVPCLLPSLEAKKHFPTTKYPVDSGYYMTVHLDRVSLPLQQTKKGGDIVTSIQS